MSEQSPFKKKEYGDIYNAIMDHLVRGHVYVHDEKILFSTGTLEYTLGCGDVASSLLNIERIYGIKDNSFYEFILDVDFIIDNDNNSITFNIGLEPDDGSYFYVSYYYDSKVVSGISDIKPDSVISVMMASVSRRIAEVWNGLENIRDGGWIDTAEGSDLDELVKLIGVERNAASKASGFVVFYRDNPENNISVDAGTVVATMIQSNLPHVEFQTTELVTFQDGFLTVRAPIEATDPYAGAIGNIRPNSIINILSPSSASRVDNPISFDEYEFIDLVEGRYNYSLEFSPVRTVSQNGRVMVTAYYSEDVSDWTPTDCLVQVGGGIESGVVRLENSSGFDGSGYIQINVLANGIDLSKHEKVMIRVRGTTGNTCKIEVEDDTSSIESKIISFTDSNWTMDDLISSSVNNAKYLRIFPYEAGSVIFVDFIIVGHDLVEVYDSGTLKADGQGNNNGTKPNDNYLVNYSQKKISLRYNNDTENFFIDYDEANYLFIYYRFYNNISGGTDRENDEALRERAKLERELQAKGTKVAIRAAVLDIDGVYRCQVSDHDDNASIDPGRIEVYVMSQGFSVSPALQDEIVAVIDDTRAAGIKADVFTPLIRYANFILQLVYDDSIYTTVGQVNEIKVLVLASISDYFQNTDINKDLHFSDLVGKLINEVDGVIAGEVLWQPTDPTTPTPLYSDEYFAGDGPNPENQYHYDSAVVKTIPYRISVYHSSATVVIQRGNISDESLIQMVKKSDL